MERLYIPYVEGGPLIININGHNLLLVGVDREVFENSSLFDAEVCDAEVVEYELDEVPAAIEYSTPSEFGPFVVRGGDDGVPFPDSESGSDGRIALFAQQIAVESGSGVVVIPPSISLDQLLVQLEQELPWCH
ncbi:MAG: hypothetical protein KDD70_13640 [Bdellovibrionales bacterium]|nr:hypothetical protein [Bdellovibrionales bacterium]